MSKKNSIKIEEVDESISDGDNKSEIKISNETLISNGNGNNNDEYMNKKEKGKRGRPPKENNSIVKNEIKQDTEDLEKTKKKKEKNDEKIPEQQKELTDEEKQKRTIEYLKQLDSDIEKRNNNVKKLEEKKNLLFAENMKKQKDLHKIDELQEETFILLSDTVNLDNEVLKKLLELHKNMYDYIKKLNEQLRKE